MPNSPTLQEYLDAANAVYQRDTSSPDGDLIVPLKSASLDVAGFYATAFIDTTGNLIVAFEGTNPSLSVFGVGSLDADLSILQGQIPLAFSLAEAFVSSIHQLYGSLPIYVDGHSLGGAEADFVAAALGATVVTGGVTFGAPGLPGYAGPANQGNITDYVDRGDPIGNFALDGSSLLHYLPGVPGSHFGTVISIGSPWSISQRLTFTNAVPVVVQAALDHHSLSNYAADLGYSIDAETSTDSAYANSVAQPISQRIAAYTSSPNSSTSTPVVESPSNVSLSTDGTVLLSSWFAAAEIPSGTSHDIDHYSIFIVRGSSNILIGSQVYALGSIATNITAAQFATARFSAGSNPGISEIAVIAFDDQGVQSIAADTTVTITAPAPEPQPILPADSTPPVIMSTGQTLITGIGSKPTLGANLLQVSDANAANFTPGQLIYTIVSAPTHGYILKSGIIVSSFTQADVNNGIIEYQENGTVAPSDSFTYYVSDPAGNRSPNTAFDIGINSPATTTHPSISTNSSLSVGSGQTAIITNTNLSVVDSGANPWQIIYTVTKGPAHGRIVADGLQTIQWFTQQQVDLGLISYQNTDGSSGPDNLIFTVSDASGGNIGLTTFGINVIPKNNLSVKESLNKSPIAAWVC